MAASAVLGRVAGLVPALPWYAWAALAAAGVLALGSASAGGAADGKVARPPGPPPLLKLGSKGPWVAYLRSLLEMPPGDSFDESVHGAVVQFQKDHSLDGDGKVGPKTWGALGVSATAPKPGGKPSVPDPVTGAGGGPLSDSMPERWAQILAAVKAGEVEHQWHILSWEACGHTASIAVSRRALAITTGGERLIVSANYDTAQAIADVLGASLLTTRVADEIWRQADKKIAPPTRPITSTTAAMVDQSAKIDALVGDASGLVANEGKDWVITRRNFLPPDGTGVESPQGATGSRHNGANFGWHGAGSSKSPGGEQVIQSVGLAHSRTHDDYSQLLRFMLPDSLKVDGSKRSLLEVLADPELSCVLNDEGGILPDHVHPDLLK